VSRVQRVVSGGQAGVDRAALDVAIELGIPYGGWCPAGGWAEDLEPPGLLSRYPGLKESPSAEPAQRTRWNVRDSDATLVVSDGSVSRGTALAVAVAYELGRFLLVVRPDDVEGVRAFLPRLPEGAVLNVAGPRASEWPGGYASTAALLRSVLREGGSRT
jgi:hypothetical protein